MIWLPCPSLQSVQLKVENPNSNTRLNGFPCENSNSQTGPVSGAQINVASADGDGAIGKDPSLE